MIRRGFTELWRVVTSKAKRVWCFMFHVEHWLTKRHDGLMSDVLFEMR
jgi:hypothetical protein